MSESLHLVLALNPEQHPVFEQLTRGGEKVTAHLVDSRQKWQQALKDEEFAGLLCVYDLNWAQPETLAQELKASHPRAWTGLLVANDTTSSPTREPFDVILPICNLCIEEIAHRIPKDNLTPTTAPPQTAPFDPSALEEHGLNYTLQEILDSLDEFLSLDIASVYWVDHQAGVLTLRMLHSQDAPRFRQLETFPIPLGKGIAGLVAESGQALMVNHAESDPRSIYPGDPPATEHLISIPILLDQKVVGVLNLTRLQDPPFTEEDFRLARLLVAHMNLAVENAYLLEQTRQHAQELKRAYALVGALNRVGIRLTSAEAPEEVLHTLGKELRALNIYTILLRYDPLKQRLHLTYTSLSGSIIRQVEALLGKPITALYFAEKHWPHSRIVLHKGQPAFGMPHRRDLQTLFPELDPSTLQRFATLTSLQESIRLAQVPLRVHQRTVGVLLLWGPDILENDIPALRTFGTQVAMALEKAEKLAHERRRVKQLDALRAALADISGRLEPQDVLHTILQRGIALLDADAGEIALFHPERRDLEIVASQNVEDGLLGTRIPLGLGAIGQAALHGEPILINDYPHWPQANPRYKDKIRAVITTPLLAGSTITGAISIIVTTSDRQFTDQDLHLLALYAHQAAIVLENARLFQEVKNLSMIDELTGLFNRRHLFNIGRREFSRAHRFSRPLTVIMFDLDHFKQVNDTYGHRIGDQVLHGVAQRCLDNLREVDVLARYGGEEFTVILPETHIKAGVVAAERLRHTVEHKPFATLAGRISITISLGVAELQSKMGSFEDLLEAADQALYQAKQSGRNRVVAFNTPMDSL